MYVCREFSFSNSNLYLLSISISGVACSVSLVMHKLIGHTVFLPFFVPSQSAITCILIVTFTHGFGRSISVAPFDHRVPPTTTGAPPRLHDAPMRTVGVAKVHPTVPCNDVVLGDKRAVGGRAQPSQQQGRNRAHATCCPAASQKCAISCCPGPGTPPRPA